MSTEVQTSNWRLVQIGRIVRIEEGPYAGKLAIIVEVIDHKRVLVDAPSCTGLVRHSIPLAHLILTPIVCKSLPRGARNGKVTKVWEKEEVDNQWNKSAWAQKLVAKERRRQLTDFERFRVMVLRKQRRFDVRKAAAKA
ncbi:uncharacterized protein LAJ45_01732 [Morchella importuna]|uniref:KOW domain-containing protein n=1 Tax=Morchella conica CCBAS932 TaxID=1392247 RepID=A0A3N4KZ63_9PEZI|nr:uncharacterized protein LAJ45_01732 [Morchella importuna]KAH8153965.1 hypothetical protein LAJ45_01732 [Morchella importuna]RPB13631.1 hypothetical protein P167DRAFT_558325 [Morchella conica CCBAS932]